MALNTETFGILKPLCVELAKNCSVENINQLHKACQKLSSDQLQPFQEYLMFPICLALKSKVGENVIIECLKFSNFVFKTTEISTWTVFHDIMQHMFSFISGPVTLQSNTSIYSEELKSEICHCVEAMLINCSVNIVMTFYSQEFCLYLAQFIYALLALLKGENSKSLRLSALKALSAVLYVHENIIQLSTVITIAADRLAAFLPGISTGFYCILCGDNKQGYLIFKLTLKYFGDFLLMLIGDNKIDDNCKILDVSDHKIPQITRNSKWINSISMNIEIIIKKITEIASHEHWQVRQELAIFSMKILCNCSKNVPNCISPLLQILFVLNVDNYEQVAETSQKAINTFSEYMLSVKTLSSVLEEDVYTISSKLIKIHLSTNDTQKLLLLKQLEGYLELLGNSINLLLYSYPHLDKFFISLLNLVKFDCTDISLFAQNIPPLGFDCKFFLLWPKQRFKYFSDDEITSRISSVCLLLGSNGDIMLLIDYLIEKHRCAYKNETLFLINCMLKSLNSKSEGRNVECSNHVIEFVLRYFMSNDVWALPFSNYSLAASDIPENFKENILHICLVLECIAICSSVLKINFRQHLMDVLCPVMEKAGCYISMIAQTGSLVLHHIAVSCEYNSVSALILNNADYLVNNMMTNLYHFEKQSETVVVLQVTVEQSDATILPLVTDLIYEMLKIMDLHQEQALTVMKILKPVVIQIKKWFSVQEVTIKGFPSISKSLSSSLRERHYLRKQESGFISEQEIDIDSVFNEKMESAKEIPLKTSPLYVKILSEILGRCAHMLSSEQLELVIIVLEIIDVSILAMRNEMEEVLPYIHKIWNPLVTLFSRENVQVLTKAFSTLMTIANECGDFIKSRTMKDVWPKLLTFLKTQMVLSYGKLDSSGYFVTAGYKLQLLVLSEIGNFSQKLDLTEKEFENLVVHCLPYLSKGQPLPLQIVAKKSLENLSVMDCDALWFLYNEHYGTQKSLLPKHKSLKTICFCCHLSHNIQTNVFQL